MSIWLRRRLFIWLCVTVVAVVAWNARAIQAQSGGPGIPGTGEKLSRDEAARRFLALMKMTLEGPGSVWPGMDRTRAMSCVSPKSYRQFNKDVAPFLQELALDWSSPRQTVRVQSEGDKTATVVVEEDSAPAPHPLVLVEENGGWGVDLLETYAKWNHLEGVAKAEAIYRITGIETSDLPLTPEFLRERENQRRASCQTNLKQVMLGVLMYTQDYDERLPIAQPWIDVLLPYLKSETIFNCPSIPRGQRYGYAYNAKLARKDTNIFPETRKIVTLYETSDLRRNAYGTGQSLDFRHDEGANYAFLDGHIKWLSKENVPSFNLGRTVAPGMYRNVP